MKWRFWGAEEQEPEGAGVWDEELDEAKAKARELLERAVNLGIEADNLLRRW